MTHHKFICGDVLDALAALPDQSVHCIVTSPPYWGLRDYGVSGQLGLEPTPEEYVDRLVTVFREARRVLRSDGTLWLNLGDSYAGSWGSASHDINGKARRTGTNQRPPTSYKQKGLKPKDLVGIPWRVAFALQADGWYLRSDIIWAKPNPMPESVKDRPTKAHEYIFLLSKSAKYFYDAEAIREPVKPWNAGRMSAPKMGKHKPTNPYGLQTRKVYSVIKGANRRSVWIIPTHPFPEAHFATFPLDLVEPCIMAGTSKRGCCPTCGNPYVRETMRTGHESKRELAYVPDNNPTKTDSSGWAPATMATDNWIAGCECNAGDSIPCTVLDPFGGSGTVSMVAQHLGRDSVYIDINPDYREMAIRRCGFRENRLFELATYEVLEVAS